MRPSETSAQILRLGLPARLLLPLHLFEASREKIFALRKKVIELLGKGATLAA